ncbi:Hypothetical protein D9617_96g011920 [Elsinoe fawcettii]|nr:Hypothetical protein D9617_96g011920 [Elsinoe fawcettii]
MSDTRSEAGGHRRSSSRDEPRSRTKLDVEPFYGDRAHLGRFLTQLKTYFLLERDKYPDNRSRILYAAMQLKGAAFGWFEPYLNQFLDGRPSDETKAIFSDFDVFQAKIKQVFNISDERRVAATKIGQLKQRGSTSQYYSHFQQLTAHLDWDQNALHSAFYQGLSDAVKDQMIPNPPTTLQELITMAISIDNRLHERRMERKGGYRPNVGYQRSPRYGDPMELDAMRQGRPSRAGGKGRGGKFLNGKEREKCRRENLCFKCERPGHRARECRQGAPADGLHMMIAGPVETKADTTAEDLTTSGVGEETQTGSTTTREARESSPDVTHDISTTKNEPQHDALSWTACYDPNCTIHLADKQGSGWFPHKPTKRRSQPKQLYQETDPESLPMIDMGHDRPWKVVSDNHQYTIIETRYWDASATRKYSSITFSPHGEPQAKDCHVSLWKCTNPDCEWYQVVHSHDVLGEDAVCLETTTNFSVIAMGNEIPCSQVRACTRCDLNDCNHAGGSDNEDDEIGLGDPITDDSSEEEDGEEPKPLPIRHLKAYLTGMWRDYMMIYTHYWYCPPQDYDLGVPEPVCAFDATEWPRGEGRIIPIRVCTNTRCDEWGILGLHGHQGTQAPVAYLRLSNNDKTKIAQWVRYQRWTRTGFDTLHVQGSAVTKN